MPAFKLTYTIEQLHEHLKKAVRGDVDEWAFWMALDPRVLQELLSGALVYVEDNVRNPKSVLQDIVRRWATLTCRDREAFISSLDEDLLSPPVSGPDLEAIIRRIPAKWLLR